MQFFAIVAIFACAPSRTDETLATCSTAILPALECACPGSLLHLRSSQSHHSEFRDLCCGCLQIPKPPTTPSLAKPHPRARSGLARLDYTIAINLASLLGDYTRIVPVKPPDYSRFMLYAFTYLLCRKLCRPNRRIHSAKLERLVPRDYLQPCCNHSATWRGHERANVQQ